MNAKLYYFLLIIANFLICNLHAAYILLSPNGKIQLSVILNSQKLTYSVINDGIAIVSESPLGIITSKEDFSTSLTYVSSSSTIINETYQLPSGKTHNYLNNCNELDIKLTKNTNEFHVIRLENNEVDLAYNKTLKLVKK